MEFLTGITASILAALFGLIASFVSAKLANKRRQNIEKIRKKAKEQYKKALAQEISEYSKHIPNFEKDPVYKVMLAESATTPITIASTTAVEAQKETDAIIEDLKERISEIENRLPGQETVDKIASINDAILATQIESLSETVKKIEDKLLSRWDVAKIVFQILAAVGALVGIGLAIIMLFLNKPAH